MEATGPNIASSNAQGTANSEEITAAGFDGSATLTSENKLIFTFDPEHAHPKKVAKSPVVLDPSMLLHVELRPPKGQKPGAFVTGTVVNSNSSPRAVVIDPGDDIQAWKHLAREVVSLQNTGQRRAQRNATDRVVTLWQSEACTLVASPTAHDLPDKGYLTITEAEFVFNGDRTSLKIGISAIGSIRLEGLEEAKSRLGSAILFGWWALAAKGSEQQVYMTIETSTGELTVIQIRKRTVPQTRGELSSILSKRGITLSIGDGGAAPAPGGPDIIDQIKRLGELKDAGVVTDEEFQSKKTDLLGRL